MKFRWFLVTEAVLCFLLGMSGISWVSGVMTFPFAQIAQLLRLMSLSGYFGNIAAILIYSLICTSPVVILMLLLRKREFSLEDILLPVLSLMLFGGIYLMINPGLMNELFPVFADTAVWQGTICAMIWCVTIAYGVFRLVRRTNDASMEALLGIFEYALRILVCIVIFQIFTVYVSALFSNIRNAASISIGVNSVDAIIFYLLIFVANVLPCVMELGVLLAGLKLLHWLKTDYYCEETLRAADVLSKSCVRMLTVTVVSNLIFNFLQLFFSSRMMNIDLSVNLPLDLMLFALAALLLARFIRQNHALKAENDSFI